MWKSTPNDHQCVTIDRHMINAFPSPYGVNVEINPIFWKPCQT
ncbi:hypothetical protein WEU38_11285 [Cyanobacterium aponinum AL20118]